jgi:hypothetical protein
MGLGLKPACWAVMIAAMMLPGRVGAFELTGAWASSHELCDRVFVKKGNTVNFAELSDLFGSGFIVDGKAMRGKSAKCTIKSSKPDGDLTNISASCATSIMTGEYQFSYKVVDDNTIMRLFPDIKDMTLRYFRCLL